MNSPPLYLMSGGWNTVGVPETYGRFIRASAHDDYGTRILVVVTKDVAEEAQNSIRDAGIFSSQGLSDEEVFYLPVSKSDPLSIDRLSKINPTGLLIWGGVTANYWAALCADTSWLEFLRDRGVPYAGVSAGSQIVSERAIIDGWKIRENAKQFLIAPNELSEGIDELEIRNGLGILHETIEVHATSEGALSRLIHAVEQQIVPFGYAIDDDTLLHIEESTATVYGLGHVYRVERLENGRVLVDLFSHKSRFNVEER